MKIKFCLWFVWFSVIISAQSSPDVSVTVKTYQFDTTISGTPRKYYISIPTLNGVEIDSVRGILIASHYTSTNQVVLHPGWHRWLYDHRFVYADPVDNYNGGEPYELQNKLFEKWAVQLNLPELKYAPICIMGYSAATIWMLKYINKNPDRIIAAMPSEITNGGHIVDYNFFPDGIEKVKDVPIFWTLGEVSGDNHTRMS